MSNRNKKMSMIGFEVQGKPCAVALELVEGIAVLPEVVAVPGVSSRVFVGLAYILGQLMSVVDIAPLLNIAGSRNALEALIVRVDGEYYALKVTSVGGIITRPRIIKMKKALCDGAVSYFDYEKKRFTVIDAETIVTKYICS